jgi:hypothetical protein
MLFFKFALARVLLSQVAIVDTAIQVRQFQKNLSPLPGLGRPQWLSLTSALKISLKLCCALLEVPLGAGRN